MTGMKEVLSKVTILPKVTFLYLFASINILARSVLNMYNFLFQSTQTHSHVMPQLKIINTSICS